MHAIRSYKVKNRNGEEQLIDVFPGTAARQSTAVLGRTVLKARNGRRARKLDKGVYEIDGLKGVYRTNDPAAP